MHDVSARPDAGRYTADTDRTPTPCMYLLMAFAILLAYFVINTIVWLCTGICAAVKAGVRSTKESGVGAALWGAGESDARTRFETVSQGAIINSDLSLLIS